MLDAFAAKAERMAVSKAIEIVGVAETVTVLVNLFQV